jgi:hypothetical protein
MKTNNKMKRIIVLVLAGLILACTLISFCYIVDPIEGFISKLVIVSLAIYGLNSILLMIIDGYLKPKEKSKIDATKNYDSKSIIIGYNLKEFTSEAMREVMKGSFDHNLDRILGFIRVTAKEGDNSLKLKKGIFPYYDEKNASYFGGIGLHR